MNLYIETLQNEIKNKPQQLFVGVCIFFVAVMGTSVHHVASTAFAFLLIASFFILLQWKEIWQQLNGTEKLFLVGFMLYAISGMIAYINVQDTQEYIKNLERHARFLAAVPVYLFIKRYKIDVINYLYAGAIVSGPFLFFIAMQSYIENPDAPARGQYHHTIFGVAAMLNVGVMMTMLLSMNLSKLKKFFILLAMICGFVAALLSQSRGVWLVMPIYLIITLYYSFSNSKINFAWIVLILALAFAAVINSPVGNMVNTRVTAAVEEVAAYYDDGHYTSSLGTRLAMWTIAVEEWKKHPIVGSGPGDFNDTIIARQKDGELVGMDIHNSVHNIYFQALFSTGAIGVLALIFGIILMPLRIMFSSASRLENAWLVGVVVVVVFSVAGISMSWIIRSSSIAMYILYMLVIVSSIYSLNNNANKSE